jgi:hypothetical protein
VDPCVSEPEPPLSVPVLSAPVEASEVDVVSVVSIPSSGSVLHELAERVREARTHRRPESFEIVMVRSWAKRCARWCPPGRVLVAR